MFEIKENTCKVSKEYEKPTIYLIFVEKNALGFKEFKKIFTEQELNS